MRKIFLVPMIWLILGAVAIATEIKTSDPFPLGQPLSGTVLVCIRWAVNTKETALISAATTYQSGYLTALTAKKTAVLAAWNKTTKKEIKSALTAASKTYKTTLTTLKKTLKSSQKSAQTAYKTAIKTCKSPNLQDLVAADDIED